jgi:RNA polymerase sigma-70 factor, ECF subfamily
MNEDRAMELAVAIASPDIERRPLPDQILRDVVLEQYDRDHLALRRYVTCLGMDADAAQDVVHEAFVKLFGHLAAGGDRTNLHAWLYRVVHNLSRNRQTKTEASHGSLDDLTGFAEPVAADASPEQKLLADERERRLRRAIDSLPETQRECLILRAQGLKYREIAETVGLSVSTVAEHIQRGLDAVKGSV